jgi:hypothetical protein
VKKSKIHAPEFTPTTNNINNTIKDIKIGQNIVPDFP